MGLTASPQITRQEVRMIRKTLFCSGVVLVVMLMLSAFADAVMIKNVSDQRLLIPFPGNKRLDLVPGATASITNSELSTPAVQNHIRSGRVKVVPPRPKLKPKRLPPP